MHTLSKTSRTPLHNAAFVGDLDAAKALVADGVDIDALTIEHFAPLHVACLQGNTDMVKFLLSAGASTAALELGKTKTATPLHMLSNADQATPEDMIQMAQLLIDAKAPLEAKDHDGITPLHAACFHSKPDLVRVLLAAGADVHATDVVGGTPLHFASVSHQEAHDIEVAQLLVAAGADLDALDGDGHTAEEKAKIKKLKDLGYYLQMTKEAKGPKALELLLVKNQLQQYQSKLKEVGCDVVSDLLLLTQTEVDNIGFKPVHLRKFEIVLKEARRASKSEL
jgi:ankyrin repeat protein